MNQAPPPPPGFRKPHMCFSGSLSCSGCAPCEACIQHVRSYVLPVAMAAGGFAGDQNQARAFFDAYTRVGWPRLQEAMLREPQIRGQLGDPGLKGRYSITDIGDIQQALAELEMYRAQARAAAVATEMQQQGSGSPGAFPFSPPPESPPFGPPFHNGQGYPPPPFANGAPPYPPNGVETAYPPSENGALYSPYGPPAGAAIAGGPNGAGAVNANGAGAVSGSGPVETPMKINVATPIGAPVVTPAPERTSPMTREMDAEDIAAASAPGRGAVLGNVMTVPPGMEHHLEGIDKK